MPRDDIFTFKNIGSVKKLLKFHISVAVNAWIGRYSVLIAVDEFLNNFFSEII